ncbi:uncharacterized protein LOC117804102 isoform X3 [Ailuropoda melanoleuca]|uniref:uncharacterized protein LOC117804102 isoform X3 n=1 Tax=Ailuropoda melanoleuca TaxID=9646 RepID=UPI001494283A|nr:uncharacterized protein LOC117804102 isoform X3 [Ailuropoda melanoleuca]
MWASKGCLCLTHPSGLSPAPNSYGFPAWDLALCGAVPQSCPHLLRVACSPWTQQEAAAPVLLVARVRPPGGCSIFPRMRLAAGRTSAQVWPWLGPSRRPPTLHPAAASSPAPPAAGRLEKEQPGQSRWGKWQQSLTCPAHSHPAAPQQVRRHLSLSGARTRTGTRQRDKPGHCIRILLGQRTESLEAFG